MNNLIATKRVKITDDLALLSHIQKRIRVKTENVAATSVIIGLNIHRNKAGYNTTNTYQITFGRKALKDLETFVNLRVTSLVNEEGSDADLEIQVAKTRVAFLQLKNICN